MLPFALLTPTVAPAQTIPPTTPATATEKYSVEQTLLGTLLDDPAAKAVLVKHLPNVVSNKEIDMARTFTLKALQNYAADQITDAKLAAINADLEKLPAKK
ncbi:hypothetical protein [Sphingomonas sp. Leaf67]|uniref:hypothetical protein n=1 Tax=Sphingomonas sp. Leaf67 TaxID=1736230 RepID=UPI001F305202|nr:hypothetical protein [Sphingomonas sp. Leaf67]